VRAEDGNPIPLRSYKGILSTLGYSPHPLTREEIIAEVWPEVPLNVGRNRLRVALVKLRSLMPGAVIEHKGGLQLDPEVVSSDAHEARQAIERSQDSVTTAGEFETLLASLEPRGDGTTFDRLAPGAGPFGEALAKAWLRAGELAAELNQFEVAADATRTATFFDPESTDAWAEYLLAQWRIGNVQGAAEDVKGRAPLRVQSDPKFQATVKDLRARNPGVRERLSSDRRMFWLEIVDLIEESRPDLMRTLLSAPQTLSLSGKQPRLMHDLLEKATPLDLEEKDTTWERSAARMIGLKAWLGDAKGVLETAPAVINTSTDVQILRAVWNAVAVAHSLVRDWDKAHEALARTLEYSRLFGSEMYELTTKGNGAYFKMQQGRFGEAHDAYEEIMKRLAEVDTNQAKFEHAIAIGNRALIPVFQGNWAEAITRLETAMDVRSKRGLQVHMGMLHASIALVRANLGRMETVANSMRLAFLDAFESDSFRSQQFTFDVAAATIAVLGDAAYAQSLAHWCERWRRRTQAPRSEAERLLVSRIPKVARDPSVSGDPPMVGKETMRRIRFLTSRTD